MALDMKAIADALPRAEDDKPTADDLATPEVGKLPINVSWDLETLNLARDSTNHIVEYGAALYDPITQKSLGTHVFYVRPEGWVPATMVTETHPRHADASYWSNIDKARSLRDHAKEIFSIMDGQTWIGHNILSFDIPVLKADLEAIASPVPHPVRVIDTLVLLERWGFRGRYVPDLKLATLMKFYGLGEQSHLAGGDCMATYAVLSAACASRAIASLRETWKPASPSWRRRDASRKKSSSSPPRRQLSMPVITTTTPEVEFVVHREPWKWAEKRRADPERFGNASGPPKEAIVTGGTSDVAARAFAKALQRRETPLYIHGAYQTAGSNQYVEILCLPTNADEKYGTGTNFFLNTTDPRSYRFDRFAWVRLMQFDA
jgi:hypothetical protein